MLRGIRARITALASVAVAVVLIVAGVALVHSQRRLLTDNLDESLLTHSATLAHAVATGQAGTPLAAQGDDDSIAQIVDDEGQVTAATANFQGRPALASPPGNSQQQFRSMKLLPGEADYRVLSQRSGSVVISTGAPLDDIEESLAALRLGLFVAIPLVALTLAALIWWLVGRTLQPVEAIRLEVADITGRNLHRRVPEPKSDDEIAELARTMNAMLDRVAHAADRQQRFVADASHELRSPLTRIRTELEVDLGHPGTADLAATHRSVLEETEHLQRLVEDLLLLARSDASRNENLRSSPVDLDDIVMRETRRLRDTSTITLDTTGVSAAQVSGDSDELLRAIRNLFDNATRHARSTITVTLVEAADHAALTVADDGPGIPASLREQVFERFVRLDEARTHNDGGTGLGLAITREIIQRHGGTIRIDANPTHGARFIIELPLSRNGTADPAT